jgi:hypothetical protein
LVKANDKLTANVEMLAADASFALNRMVLVPPLFRSQALDFTPHLIGERPACLF